jgi:hypothetical protein
MYQINVDREIPNVPGGQPACRSPMHAHIGPHHEITIHEFPSECRPGIGATRPSRFWDDNAGQGFALAAVASQAQAIILEELGLKIRRCRRCRVPPHLPDWD